MGRPGLMVVGLMALLAPHLRGRKCRAGLPWSDWPSLRHFPRARAKLSPASYAQEAAAGRACMLFLPCLRPEARSRARALPKFSESLV